MDREPDDVDTRQPRRQWGGPLLLVGLLLLATGVAAVLLTGGGDGEPASSSDDPLTTPDGTVLAFYEAVRQGECEAADGLRTDALRAEADVATDDRGCADVAAWVAEHPDRVDEVLPQVSVEVRYQDESVAVVDTTFRFSDSQPDRIEDGYLVRRPDGTWAMATRSEAESLEPDNPHVAADMIVFLEANPDDALRTTIEALLDQHVGVQRFIYVDGAASAAEFRRLFQDNQAMLDRLEEGPERLPTSYRVVLTALGDQAATDALTAELQRMPGVQRVVPMPD